MAGPVTLDGLLRFAIAHARLIEFTYHSVSRVAEPHDYGVHHGATRLLVYQGSSDSTRMPGWRLLDVSKIERLVVLEETFRGSRGATYRQHTNWDELFARVGLGESRS